MNVPEGRNGDTLASQVRQEGFDGVEIDQVLRVSDGDDRPEYSGIPSILLPLLVEHPDHFRCRQTTEIELYRMAEPQEILQAGQPFLGTLGTPWSLLLQADSLGGEHLPYRDHPGERRYFEQDPSGVRNVDVFGERPMAA
jgi:hypothetical protein